MVAGAEGGPRWVAAHLWCRFGRSARRRGEQRPVGKEEGEGRGDRIRCRLAGRGARWPHQVSVGRERGAATGSGYGQICEAAGGCLSGRVGGGSTVVGGEGE